MKLENITVICKTFDAQLNKVKPTREDYNPEINRARKEIQISEHLFLKEGEQ